MTAKSVKLPDNVISENLEAKNSLSTENESQIKIDVAPSI